MKRLGCLVSFNGSEIYQVIKMKKGTLVLEFQSTLEKRFQWVIITKKELGIDISNPLNEQNARAKDRG